MDTFIKNIDIINSKYNDIYVTYLLYRIWIKYKKLVIYVTSRDNYYNVLELLRIPKKYHELDIVFPLSNYMFYDNRNKVDKTILSNFLEIDIKMKDFTNIDDNLEIKNYYDNLMKYINEINSEYKIEEILNQFRKKINLQHKNIYIKNLVE